MKSRILKELQEVPDSLKSYQPSFLQSRLKEFNDLQGALESEDREQMGRLAHSWKGFSAPYGFGYLGELAATLDEQVKANESFNQMGDTLTRIKECLDICSGIIEQN